MVIKYENGIQTHFFVFLFSFEEPQLDRSVSNTFCPGFTKFVGLQSNHSFMQFTFSLVTNIVQLFVLLLEVYYRVHLGNHHRPPIC